MQYINKKNEMSKKIGILLVESLPLPPVKGGAVENLTQLIIDNNEDRHDLDIYVFSKYDGAAAAEAKQYHNTQYKYCNPSGIYVLIDILLKVVRRICRNYLHINTPSLYEIKAYRYFKQQGIKTLILENCPAYALYQSRKSEFELIQHLHNDYLNASSKINDLIFQHTQRIFTVSNFIKSRLQPIVPSSIPVDVCHNGIDLQRFELPIETQKKQELQKRYGISSTDRVITFTGRLVNNKGVKELMLAFEKVAAKHNDAKLLIVGGQSFSNNVKDDYVIDLEFIASRIGNGVIFTGYVDYSEITSYLQLSTIVVVPSTSFEAFPLSILEAMAAGIPVVVSDAGGTLEVIDERSGIVVNRGEGLIDGLSTAIEDLCFDDEKLHKMSVAAKRRSKVFSDKTMYNRFVDLLK